MFDYTIQMSTDKYILSIDIFIICTANLSKFQEKKVTLSWI